MYCPCGYHFALDPKTDGISDRRFISFINGASCNGTFSFTETQLYTAACRKQLTGWSGKSVLVLAGLLAVFLILALITENSFFFIFAFGVLTFTLLGAGNWVWCRFIKRVSLSQFNDWFDKYSQIHGPIKGLIETAGLSEPPPEVGEPDVYDYGVERVLIVQRQILVDLLIANRIHLANRSVIVSGDGYPRYIAATVEKLLEESPELPVFLLHDADEEGTRWAQSQQERYQSSGRSVTDMGLSPDTVKKIRKLSVLKLKAKQYRAAVDALPMAMLANGIALSMEHKVSMHDLLIGETSVDILTSFG